MRCVKGLGFRVFGLRHEFTCIGYIEILFRDVYLFIYIYIQGCIRLRVAIMQSRIDKSVEYEMETGDYLGLIRNNIQDELPRLTTGFAPTAFVSSSFLKTAWTMQTTPPIFEARTTSVHTSCHVRPHQEGSSGST